MQGNMAKTGSQIAQQIDCEKIRYSKVWEDHKLLMSGINIQPQDNVLCITGAGDNVLNLLLQEPRAITAVDLSVGQNSLLELKVAGIKHLKHSEFVRLVGHSPSSNEERLALFSVVKDKLSKYAKDFWERHTDIISHGLTFQGKADESFPMLNWDDIVGEKALEDFFTVPSLAKQQAIFNSWPLEELKKRFRGLRAHITHRLNHNKRFQFIEQSDAEIEARMWGRLVHICTHIPAKDNYFLSWYLRGSTGYDPLTKPDFCPPYLQEKSFERLKTLLDRLTIVTSTIEDYLSTVQVTPFDKVSISDILEWMPKEKFSAFFELLASKCSRGARIVHWGLFDPNPCPKAMIEKGFLVPLTELASSLFEQDRVFFYADFHLTEVQKK